MYFYIFPVIYCIIISFCLFSSPITYICSLIRAFSSSMFLTPPICPRIISMFYSITLICIAASSISTLAFSSLSRASATISSIFARILTIYSSFLGHVEQGLSFPILPSRSLFSRISSATLPCNSSIISSFSFIYLWT